MDVSHTIRTGTISGTVLSILPVVSGDDILRTVVLAIIGAATSVIVTVLLKRLFTKK